MKKTVYTLAFIALFSVMANAQAPEKAKKQEPAKSATVNPDGTVAPAGAATEAQPAEGKKSDTKPASGTRMAITEKGVPASKKPAEGKKAEPAKTEKH